jgi:hypothetical protein
MKADPEIVVTDAGMTMDRSDSHHTNAKSRMRDSFDSGSKLKFTRSVLLHKYEPSISISLDRIAEFEPKYDTNRIPLKSTMQSPAIAKFTFSSSIKIAELVRIPEFQNALPESSERDAGRIIHLSRPQKAKARSPIEVSIEPDSIPIWEKWTHRQKHD